MPSGANRNFVTFGRVVGVHIDDDLIVNGRVDICRARPIARMGYMDYATIDSVFEMIKARLPWLLIGMAIELIASFVLKNNEVAFHKYETLIIFVPLLSATAGNIGVQASAIVVQGLANGSLKEFSKNYFKKELIFQNFSLINHKYGSY